MKALKIVGLVAGLLILGCIGLFIIGSVSPPPPGVTLPTATRPGSTATPVVLDAAGRGDDVLKWTVARSGLATFTADHSGSSNFAVEVYGPDGRLVNLVVNEIGRYSGVNAVPIREPGEYSIQITADGGWSLVIEAP